MKKTILTFAIATFILASAVAQQADKPRSAGDILESAKKTAAEQDKNI